MVAENNTLSIQGRSKLSPEQDLGGVLFEVGQQQAKAIAPLWPSTRRDAFLRGFWHAEGNEIVQGVIAGLVARIGGFSWEVTGVRGVNHFQDVLQEAEFGAGFAALLAKTLQDFWTQDIGAFWELIGSEASLDQLNGPLVPPVSGVAHLDASRCMLTGNPIYPVMWSDPVDGSLHRLHWTRVVHLPDLPSPDTRHRGYGFCAMSRLIANAEFMRMLAGHKLESVQEQLPKGLLLLQGLTRTDYDEAVDQHEEERVNLGLNYLQSIIALGGLDPERDVDVKLIPFADLPQWFVERDQVDVYARLVALAFGIDSQDVLPLANTTMGTGAQSQVLHEKARGKGVKQIIKLLERAINQRVLPPNLSFSFAAQETAEEQEQAELAAHYLQQAEQLQRLGYSQFMITRWLVERGVMDEEDLAAEEEATQRGDDVQSEPDKIGGPEGQQDEAVEQDEVADDSDDDPPDDAPPDGDGPPKKKPKKDKASLLDLRPDRVQHKQSANLATLQGNYQGELQAAVENIVDVGGSYTTRTLRSVFRRLIADYFDQSYRLGMKAGGVDDDPDADEQAQIKARVSQERSYAGNYISDLARDLRQAKSDPARTTVVARYVDRLPLWANTLGEIYHLGLLSAQQNQMLEWVVGQTKDSCPTCQAANGKRHRGKTWAKYDLRPQGSNLLCGGHNCACKLVPTSEKATTDRLSRIPTKNNKCGWRHSKSGWLYSRRKALTDALGHWAFTGRQAA